MAQERPTAGERPPARERPTPPSAIISAEFPFESHFVEVLGSKMHYVDERFPKLETHFVGVASHFLQEDHPHKIGRAIKDWHRREIKK